VQEHNLVIEKNIEPCQESSIPFNPSEKDNEEAAMHFKT
jgi:hypothetical protein